MSTPTTETTGSNDSPTQTSRSRTRTTITWILQIVGAGLFINFGLGKVTGSNAGAVETFDQIGIGQWFRVLIGSLEILGAIGLLIPIFAGLAAVCLAALAVSAMSVELFVVEDGSIVAALLCFLVVAVVAALRRRTILAPFALARRRLSPKQSSHGA